MGDQVIHASFGSGEIMHRFGGAEKVSIALKSLGMRSKILDLRGVQAWFCMS